MADLERDPPGHPGSPGSSPSPGTWASFAAGCGASFGSGLLALLAASLLEGWAGRRSLGTAPSSLIGVGSALLLLIPLLIRAAAPFKRGAPFSHRFRLGLSAGVLCFYGSLAAVYFSLVWGVR